MMLNTKKNASKKQQKKQENARTPLKLKDLNVECSSSTSSDAPRGCLRFLLSNYSSKNKCNVGNKSPKLVKKCSNLVKLGENYSAKYDLSDGVNKFTSGFQYKLCDDYENVVNLGKHGKRCDFSDKINEFSTGFGNNVSDNAEKCEDFSSVNRLGDGLGFGSFSRNSNADKLVENDTECTDAPVQGSVSASPEVQGVLLTSVVAGSAPSCNAADHVLSGVSDKRKCRDKGILTVGKDNLFASGENKSFDFQGESVVRERRNRRNSIVPFPSEASVCCFSSPCDEKRIEKPDGDGNMSELRLNQCDELPPFEFVRPLSSTSSSLGFSSDLFDKSYSIISTSDATSTSPDSRRSVHSFQHSDVSSEIRGVLGPSVDHFAPNPSPPSPISPNKDYEWLVSPTFENSLGIGNVMNFPESNCNYRSPNFDLSDLSRDQISRLWFECELDSVTEVLRRVSVSPECQISELDSPRASFEFNPLIKRDKSIDLTLLREAMEMGTPDSETRISWREGLASRIFEMDDLDCCTYLSDEDDNVNGCHGWPKPCLKSIDSDERYELVPDNSSWTGQ